MLVSALQEAEVEQERMMRLVDTVEEHQVELVATHTVDKPHQHLGEEFSVKAHILTAMVEEAVEDGMGVEPQVEVRHLLLVTVAPIHLVVQEALDTFIHLPPLPTILRDVYWIHQCTSQMPQQLLVTHL